MAPTLFARLSLLDTPIDFNKKFRGQPIFGPHKTYRGFVVGIIFAVAAVYIQQRVYPWPGGNTLIDYQVINPFVLGFLFGFGALGGDLVKSFIKRRFKIPSGWVWAPFDQLDWIIGAILLTGLVISLELKHIVTAVVIFGLLHPLVNLVGYILRIKPNKF